MPNCALARQGLEPREEWDHQGAHVSVRAASSKGGVQPFPSHFLLVSTVMEVSRPHWSGASLTPRVLLSRWAAVVPPLCLALCLLFPTHAPLLCPSRLDQSQQPALQRDHVTQAGPDPKAMKEALFSAVMLRSWADCAPGDAGYMLPPHRANKHLGWQHRGKRLS